MCWIRCVCVVYVCLNMCYRVDVCSVGVYLGMCYILYVCECLCSAKVCLGVCQIYTVGVCLGACPIMCGCVYKKEIGLFAYLNSIIKAISMFKIYLFMLDLCYQVYKQQNSISTNS